MLRGIKIHTILYTTFYCLFMVVTLTGRAAAVGPADYALHDLRVLYLFDEEEAIDWPTLYYLNDRHSCRIDLATFGTGAGLDPVTYEIPGRRIFLHRFFPDPGDSSAVDSVTARLFAVRRPDIVIFGPSQGLAFERLKNIIANTPPDSTTVFNISKIYRLVPGNESDSGKSDFVIVNVEELRTTYADRMALEIPKIIPWWSDDLVPGHRLQRYALVKRYLPPTSQDPDFTSGLRPLRLESVLDSVLNEGPLESSFRKRARNFVSFFRAGLRARGRKRVENMLAGYKEIITLEHQADSEDRLTLINGFMSYLRRLRDQAQQAVMYEIGLNWQGRIILRDSPHGPKVKFRAALSANGPQPIELSYVKFLPYWDTTVVTLDSVSRRIAPHQSFVREYLVDIDRTRLDARMPESLLFAAEIVYGRFPLTFWSSVPIWEAPNMTVRFQPSFHIVQPFARLNVDKIVASMNWKVVIRKPRHYYGKVKLHLETPRGVFAGSYRQEIQLDKGETQEIVRIPFSVSNLFELGIQHQVISLSVDGRTIAADTGAIRIASCHVSDSVRIGFLPDSTGALEDILRMTDAAFRPLTNRTLLTGDLDAYDVIVVGSGAVREYPSFRRIKGRIEEFLRQGGSLVVFGQPGDWPEGVLPIVMNPARELIKRSLILNRIENARILSRPHVVNVDDLLREFQRPQEVSAAVITPSERVLLTPTGATLLSVSRIGDGQVIYCGLPLLRMITELNLEAIHLFANILNY